MVFISVAVLQLPMFACNGEDSPISPTVEGESPTPTALPGDKGAGTDPERWGDFVLAQDEVAHKPIDRPPRRPNFNWPPQFSPFDHPNATVSWSEEEASQDTRVPLLSSVPQGEEFMAYSVIQDSNGVADIWVTYIDRDLKEVNLPSGNRPAEPDDATITIVRSLRAPSPLYITPLRTPDAERDPNLRGPGVFLDRTEKIDVNGHKGIMRIYVARNGGDTYPFRVPSVAINWFEGDVSWSFQSFHLSPDEALRVAESIRNVEGL